MVVKRFEKDIYFHGDGVAIIIDNERTVLRIHWKHELCSAQDFLVHFEWFSVVECRDSSSYANLAIVLPFYISATQFSSFLRPLTTWVIQI